MSIRSLTALAIARDNAAPSAPAGGGNGQAAIVQPDGMVAGQPAGQPVADGGSPQKFIDVITSTIPTESLSAYTALVGIAIAAIGTNGQHTYVPFRWWAYVGFLVLTVAAVTVTYRSASANPAGVQNQQNRRIFPWGEGISALVAAAGWGLVMPGNPLSTEVTGTTQTIMTACITIGTGVVLSIIAPSLKKGSKTPGQDPAANQAAAPGAGV